MRSEENPLDLNNLPEDYSKDGKQVLEDTSSYAGYRKKKSGAKDGKEECGKVYECRFCSLKFCKSQALGGHMNRHRQERETETLNRARQLVFNSDSLLGQGPHPHHHHLGGQPIPQGGYHHQTGNIADPSIQFRSVYPTRLFSGAASTAATLLPPPQPYMYSSPTRLVPFPATGSHYPAATSNHHDYFLGHVVPSNTTNTPSTSTAGQAAENSSNINNYTCIGAPVSLGTHPHAHGFGGIGSNYGSGDGGGREMGTLYNNDNHINHRDHGGGLSWGRSCTAAGTTTTTQQQQQRFDPTSINRFQDGF